MDQNFTQLVRSLMPEEGQRPALGELVSLDGQNAIVIGGAGPGLGQCITRRLAGLGASVMVVDINEDAAAKVAATVESDHGGRAVPLKADMTDPADAVRMMEACRQELGSVDVMVNSAGGGGVGNFMDQSVADYNRIVGYNLTGVLHTTRAAADVMIEQKGGAIVNVSAMAATMPWSPTAVYSACKAGVSALTRTLAWELSPHGIRINSIAPGLMASSRLASILDDADAQGQYAAGLKLAVDHTALARPAAPDEVADVVAFLATPAASFVQGAVWEVSGGMA